MEANVSFTTFGELLKHLRQHAQMTQDEFGLAVGYSRAHIARLESNQRTPDAGAVQARSSHHSTSRLIPQKRCCC